MIKEAVRHSLSRSTHIGYAIGSAGTGVFSTVPGLLLLTFMVRQLEIPAATAGVVLLVPRLWDVITDPFIGSLSDRTFTRWGARRPWMLAGSITLPVAFVLLFAVPDLPTSSLIWYILFIYILGTTTFTIYQIPYIAMPAEMTELYHERTAIMAWRIALMTIGILIGGAAAPELVYAGGGGREGYALMAWVIGIVLFFFMFGSFIGTSKVPNVRPIPSTAPFRVQARAAIQNRPFFILLGAYFIQVLGIGAMLAGVDFFSANILGDPGQTSILFACLIGPALITMPFWNMVGRRLGKLSGYKICTVLFSVGGVSLMASDPEQIWMVYLFVFIMGAAYAGTQLFPFSMLPDTISSDTIRTGLRRAGAYTGIWMAGEKAGFAVGPAIFAAILALTGYIETEAGILIDQPDPALTGVRFGFALLPALLMGSSLFVLRKYKLDEETTTALGIEQE
ncbi:MAG: MFS transporter [Bacillota bacterium]